MTLSTVITGDSQLSQLLLLAIVNTSDSSSVVSIQIIITNKIGKKIAIPLSSSGREKYRMTLSFELGQETSLNFAIPTSFLSQRKT